MTTGTDDQRLTAVEAGQEAWQLLIRYDVARHALDDEPDALEHQMEMGTVNATICGFLLRQGHPK